MLEVFKQEILTAKMIISMINLSLLIVAQFMLKLPKQEPKIKQPEQLQFNSKCIKSLFSAWTICYLSLKKKWNVISEITTYNK